MKSTKTSSNIVLLKTESPETNRLDWLKWALSLILVLAGLIGNHYYSEVSMPLRTLCWAAVLILAGFVASKTSKGKTIVEFVSESQKEMRKVVWPTKDEVRQTTLIVAAMVIILALVLWGMDTVLVWAIGWLTGQRG